MQHANPNSLLQLSASFRSFTQPSAKPDAAYPKPGINQDVLDQRHDNVASVDAEHTRRGGIPTAERDLYDHTKFTSNLAANFIPVNLDHPRTHIQHLDPPVLTVDNFMTQAECEQLGNLTEQTGTLLDMLATYMGSDI